MEKQTFHIPSFGDDEFDFQSTFPQHDDSQHSTFTQQPDDSQHSSDTHNQHPAVTRTSNHQNIFTTFTRNSGIGNDLNNRLVDNSTSLNNGLINNSNSLNNNRLSHPPPSDSFRHSQQVAPSVPRLSHPPVSQSDYSLNSALNSLDNLNPLFPPQNINIPDISVSNSVDQLHSGNSLHTSFNQEFIDRDIYNAYSSVTSQGRSPYPTHNPSRVQHSNHPLGLQHHPLNRPIMEQEGSPMNSSLTPSPLGSNSDSDDMPLAQLAGAKRGAPKGGKKGSKAAKKRKKKDPNEPQKPVSAYALFFRDTQAAIKGSNPNANFGEISKIVASMWDSLDPEQKGAYKKRTEVAKKDYLKQLAAYRASLVSKQGVIEEHPAETNSPVKPVPMVSILPSPVKMDTMSNPTQTMTHPIQKGMAMEREPILMSMPQPDSYQNNTDVSQGAYQAQAPPTQQLTQIAPKPLPQLTDVSHMQDTELQDQLAQLDNFSLQHCMRNGCGNQAVEQIGWDQEYCSNDCVVSHCRDVFTAWISARGTSYASVK
ncbi:unnamed protein product [Owenia fusiformis]|nr:unnamed protein product [Owenia fusiformis]